MELPMGTWPNLIQVLVSNVTNPTSTEMVKEATLECIGYICQDIVSLPSMKLPGFSWVY
jgi:importin subunit beta-1